MGFYGNITNTSRTQFQFDKIYPSRAEMDAGTYTDGIYAGRYVLVEYDSDVHQSSFYRAYIDNKTGQMYNAPNVIGVEENKLNVGKNDNGSNNILPIGTIFFTAENDKENKYINTIYYQVTGGLSNTTLLVEGNYKQITSDKTLLPDGTESTVSNYVKNYAIDNEKYGAGRGYDSTVWQKIYIDNIEKYIMIAELNSVVPTFDVSADAPSVEPITPHFDTQSTDLYYKLHWQPTWGMRIAEGKLPDAEDPGRITSSKDPNHGEYPSDEDVSYSKLRYNSATKEVEEDKQQPEVRYKGAIYYNKAGFEDDKHTYYNGSFKDKISVQPLGISGTLYNEHGDSVGVSEQPDIQEISIILPSLGNALCDIWDKVYGYDSTKVENNRYRDIEWKDANPKRQENGTLIYEKFAGEAIPSKDENYKGNEELGGMTRNSETLAGCINMAHDLMGMIITTSTPNVLGEDEYQKHLIYYKDKKYYRIYKYPKYKVTDNINEATEVYLVDEELENDEWKVRKYNKRASVPDGKKLAIKDTADPFGYKLVEIEDFAGNLNTINGLIVSIRNILESDNSETRNKKTVQGTINVLNDIIDCFNDLIPGEFLICNNDGKVNSAGWTTNQAIKYDNLGDGSSTEESEGEENQWINLSINADVGKEKITLKHQLIKDNHEQSDTTTKSDKNNRQYGEILTYPNVIDEETHKKTFTGINNDDNINTLKLYTPIVDNAGHVVGKNTEIVTLPFGYKYLKTNGISDQEESDLHTTFNKDGTESKPDSVTTEVEAKANSTQDQITINTWNKWIQTRIKDVDNDNIITIAHEVHKIDKTEQGTNNNGGDVLSTTKDNIVAYDVEVDAAGHVTKNQKHTYTLPYGYKTIKVANTEDSVAPASNIKEAGQIADNTQDTLTFSASNNWVKLDNNTEDTIKIGHKLIKNNDLLADKEYGLIQNETASTLSNKENKYKFEVPCFQFDKAGHITKVETHTVTLPENFDKIAVTTSTAEEEESENGTATTDNTIIKADSLVDTLTFAEGNKWINITPDMTNDKLIFSHYLKIFKQTTNGSTDYNNSNSNENTFTVQEITWDQAGHIKSSDKHTYTLPRGIQNITIANNGNSIDSYDNISSSTGTLTAGSLIDTFNIDTKNRWIQPVTDPSNKTIYFYHAEAGTEKKKSINTVQTPGFGKTFNIPVIGWDAAGHITSATKQTVTIPSPEGMISATGSSVLTGFTNDENGMITYTNGNISDLKLTGYKERPAQETETGIYTGDTINTAFQTLENLIDSYKATISNFATRIESYESTITDLKGRIEQLEKVNNPTV